MAFGKVIAEWTGLAFEIGLALNGFGLYLIKINK